MGARASRAYADGDDMSDSSRVYFFALIMCAQSLMSYDGGASAMSTAALIESGWGHTEVGFLGAMDKFGQVPMSFLCGYLLARYNNKMLVNAALLAKALSCLGFGVLQNHFLMLATKFSMGASEAMVGVWAIVWIQGRAPTGSTALWLGLQSVCAGIGNGVGQAVAGLFSPTLGYAFAFVIQAACLMAIWAIGLVLPTLWYDMDGGTKDEFLTSLAMEDAEEAGLGGRASSSLGPKTRTESWVRAGSVDDPRFMLQTTVARRLSADDIELSNFSVASSDTWLTDYKAVAKSGLWFWTTITISIGTFIQTGIQYLWQNTATTVWALDNKETTVSLLLACFVGGGLGNFLGPKLFDGKLGGFADMTGKARCLMWALLLCGITAIMGTVLSMAFFDIAYRLLARDVAHQPQGPMLLGLLIGIGSMIAVLASLQGTLIGINTESVNEQLRSTAAGCTAGVTNILGYAFGTIVPMSVVDLAGDGIVENYPDVEAAAVKGAQFSMGFSAALLAAWPLCLSVALAARAARRAAKLPDSPLAAVE
eukprot:TRINITY_DN29005_c0_g1_i1.p1 TRINITY_DN29005_c0_g1~~TRINITY_DN29005_c0_g1_i1.p1  ORF type:complete len:537 (+),score=85.26 TRINITY_DN29005_c0_g1_i1:76-1686(+)